MDLKARITCGGHEVDRITRFFGKDRDWPVAIYRERFRLVGSGFIYVESESSTTGDDERLDAAEWRVLIKRLLPDSLPPQRDECFSLFRALFGENLPDGVLCALSSLAFMGLEQEARELLVDFLCEKHDSERLSSQLQIRLFASETSSLVNLYPNASSAVDGLEPETESKLIIEDENLQDWGWSTSDDAQTPEIDDMELRAVASRIQGALGSYSFVEEGAVIPDLTQSFDSALWAEEVVLPPPASTRSPAERALMERTAQLGTVAKDVLRYFADNPGD